MGSHEFFLLTSLVSCSARFAPVKFLFEKVGRVQVAVRETQADGSSTPDEPRDIRIEKLWEAAESAGASDFEMLDGSDMIEVCMNLSSQV
jgi:transcriptional/translational regulatory protein YebC/TACO1